MAVQILACRFESFVHLHFCILEAPWQVLTQLNKCVVVCGSELQRAIVVLILFKYESSRGHLFVLSWAMVWRVALGSDARWVVWCLSLSCVVGCWGMCWMWLMFDLCVVYGVGICVDVCDVVWFIIISPGLCYMYPWRMCCWNQVFIITCLCVMHHSTHIYPCSLRLPKPWQPTTSFNGPCSCLL